jgi:hypothetical protein
LHNKDFRILGVNLIYGILQIQWSKDYYDTYDHLDKDQLEIDTINFLGLAFADVDNRLMSLQLVKMTDAVMFDPNGKTYYLLLSCTKKNILALRGSFRPVTKVNMDMYKSR